MVRSLSAWLIVLLLAGCDASSTDSRTSAAPIASPHPKPTVPRSLTSAPTVTPLRLTPRVLDGDLLNQITQLEAQMPRANSQGFVVPADAEKTAFAEIVKNLEAGEIDRAGGRAAENDYELVRYTDRGDAHAISWLLRESKPIRKGWGLYAIRQNAAQDVIVEAPHPLADEETPAIAARLYRALQARALLIAGAHRNANVDGTADAAHDAQTIFEALHESLTKSDSTVIVQIHGFAADKHPGYPQMVLGHDEAKADGVLEKLADTLRRKGVRVGICDGRSWTELCGEENIQSRHNGPAIFIHLELAESVRAKPDVLIAAFKEVLTGH